MSKGDRPKPATGLTYHDAGVDVDAGNQFVHRIKPYVAATARTGANPDIGGFGGLFDLKACGFKDPVLVAANDGVGTKLKIAIETGIHDTIGIDLVAMCVNDVIVQGAQPLFFLDYLATGKLELDEGEAIVKGIAEGCRQAGCALIGGETAEMPGMYHNKDYDLAGFAVGAVERDAILPRQDITEGDVLIGLHSTGIHANGFSLVRRVLEQTGLGLDDDAPFAPGQSVAEALLTPTEIYVKPVLDILNKGLYIKGLAHITGGGITENLPRILPQNLRADIDLNAIQPQPVFGWLAQQANIAQAEMLGTFNCGIGMITVCSGSEASGVLGALNSKKFGQIATIIGTIVDKKDNANDIAGHIKYHDALNL